MKKLITAACILISINAFTQRPNPYFNQIFDAKYMDRPPVFVAGKDSLQRVYYRNFPAFDSLITKCIEHGDTNKYIRIHFSYVIDKSGAPYESDFEKITSTPSKAVTKSKFVKYFADDKKFYKEAVKQMIYKMPLWKPGSQNGVAVNARVEDYLQIWVGAEEPIE